METKVEVKKSDLDTLDYFVKKTEKVKYKTALYIAFVKGLKRKIKENAKTKL